MNEVQERVLDSLRRDGIAVLRFQELFGEELWGAAASDIAPFVDEQEQARQSAGDKPANKEDVIVRRFRREGAEGKGKERPTLSLEQPWLRIAASETLVDIVNSYRGRQTKLYYVDNWFTMPFPGADERVASQRWHRDPEEEHVVKVFTYFSDVDEGAGPFEYVRGSASGGRYGHLWAWGVDKRYPPTEELEAAVASEDRVTLTGPAGTMFLCDTGGFHRGGFDRTKPRVLSICSYVSPDSHKVKRRYDVAEPLEALSPQIRFALG